MLKRTPFYDFHVSAGARMVDFAGWEMPIVYRSHHRRARADAPAAARCSTCRTWAGSHFSGKDAAAFLDKVLTRNVAGPEGRPEPLQPGVQRGGRRAGRHHHQPGPEELDHGLQRQQPREAGEALPRRFARTAGFDFDMADQTESTAMVAIQGPKVIERLADVLPVGSAVDEAVSAS